MPWALAMLYRWQVEGLAVGPDASVDHFEPAKTNLAFAAALILIALVPILAFTFYAKSQYDKFMGMAQAAKMMQMSAESPQTTINLGPSLPKHSPPTTPSKSFRKESVGKATIKSDGTGFVDESRKPGSSFNKAWVCARTGDFQQAEREYTRAIQANQKDRDAYYNRGLVYVQLQEYDRACADFDAALALDPRFFEAYCNRGNVRLEAGRPELAVRDYDQAIRLNPKDGDVHFNRGVALLSLGKEAQAREGFHKAAALGQKKARAQLWAAPSRVAE
jgi:tetratricopeptide (TPR) repeat protein